MSSSLRDGTMSEAADDWLRQFVHDLRREDGNNRSGKAKDALAKGKFNNKKLKTLPGLLALVVFLSFYY